METVMLRAGNGSEFMGHVAMPEGAPRGCVVVLHEAFGVTAHMMRVCEDFAEQGYAVIAPAMLSIAMGKPEGVVLAQNKAGLDKARDLIEATDKAMLTDLVAACVAWGKAQGLKVGVVGYCWGGSVAYFSAARIPELAACVSYYGGMIQDFAKEAQPTCPTLVNLAALDRYIPVAEAVAALKTYHPAAQVEVFEADHGFNRDDGVTFDAGAAFVARRLTLDMFLKNLN